MSAPCLSPIRGTVLIFPGQGQAPPVPYYETRHALRSRVRAGLAPALGTCVKTVTITFSPDAILEVSICVILAQTKNVSQQYIMEYTPLSRSIQQRVSGNNKESYDECQ